MRLLNYEYQERARQQPSSWHFSKTELGKLNLVVGDSGSGKTRFLNTIFNLGASVTGQRKLSPNDHWQLSFEHAGILYDWQIDTELSPQNQTVVTKELLTQYTKTDPTHIPLVKRTQEEFYFQGNPLPKLRSDTLSVSILKEEKAIKPIYEAFSLILRRNFFSDALMTVIPVVISPPDLLLKPVTTLSQLYQMQLPLNPKLEMLTKYFPELFTEICGRFKSVFPFVQDMGMKDLKDFIPQFAFGPAPTLCVKENYIKQWIGVHELSSGMQKVLLIITDIITLPEGGLYLIDEYENSLGVSAIDFFPSIAETLSNEVQYIITSHHPYLINNIPVENWLVFHRRGSNVRIRYGAANIEAYGKSKQQRFTQLINDPFYSKGI